MSSLNKVILLGRLGKTPEVRRTASGMAIARVSLATSTKRKNKETGNYDQETQWHRLVFFDRTAETVEKYLDKGSFICIEGSIKYGSYTDKEGVEKNTVDIVCSSLTMLGGESAKKPAKESTPQQRQAQIEADFDEDIPF